MKCPKCGYQPPRGRPSKVNDKEAKKLKREGWTLSQLAKRYGVTRGAIQAALKRA